MNHQKWPLGPSHFSCESNTSFKNEPEPGHVVSVSHAVVVFY